MDDHLKLLLEAASESAKRSRFVTILLVVATILGFMAFWNSLDKSWVRTRQQRLSDAVDYWNLTNQARYANSKVLAEKKLEWPSGWYGTNDVNLAPVLQRHLEKLRDNVDELRDKEMRWVRIAFFGIGFDVNDLGLFAGIAFSVLLVALGFFEKRELRGVKHFFSVAKQRCLERECYELLAMQQVLTVPPVPEDAEASIGWEFLAGLPLILPFFVQAAILLNDIFTIRQAEAWDAGRGPLLMVIDSAFVLLVAVFTSLCILYRRQITAQWLRRYGEFFPPDPPPGNQ